MEAMKLQSIDDKGTWARFHHRAPRLKNMLIAFAAASALALVSLPAQASVFTATMLGSNEVPPVSTTAFGFTKLILDEVADTLQVNMYWSGLLGGTPSAAHIHCCIAPGLSIGVAVGFPGFPTTLSGSYSHVFDLTSGSIYTGAFITRSGGTVAGAEAALIGGLFAGNAYTNIHNATWPGGEIRGLLVNAPEPATLAFFASGLLGLGFARRKTKRA